MVEHIIVNKDLNHFPRGTILQVIAEAFDDNNDKCYVCLDIYTHRIISEKDCVTLKDYYWNNYLPLN